MLTKQSAWSGYGQSPKLTTLPVLWGLSSRCRKLASRKGSPALVGTSRRQSGHEFGSVSPPPPPIPPSAPLSPWPSMAVSGLRATLPQVRPSSIDPISLPSTPCGSRIDVGENDSRRVNEVGNFLGLYRGRLYGLSDCRCCELCCHNSRTKHMLFLQGPAVVEMWKTKVGGRLGENWQPWS
jgi:hypothetical protein